MKSRVPVTILSGFLGAGKTTLLQRILGQPEGVRYGVLVNDFGALNIDAALIAETGTDQISLANGCVCCTIKDDLVEAARGLLDAETPPEHIIVETSGVSKPVAVAEAFIDGELKDRVTLDGVLCLVDADGFPRLDFAATELAIEQAGGADFVLINKCDIAAADDIAAVESTLMGPLPDMRLLRTRFADVPRQLLFGQPRRPAPAQAPRDGHGHDHRHEHGHGHAHGHDHAEAFESWSWESAAPLDEQRLRGALRRLPATLLRAKGVLRIAGRDDARGVIQLVGRRSTLDIAPGTPPATSQFVAISRRGALDGEALASLLDGCAAG